MVIGKGVAALADELAGYQLDEVLLVEHDLLEKYTPDGFSLALQAGDRKRRSRICVLLPHTYQVRDFAPKLAASLGKGMIGDCIGYRHENGKLIFVRQMFQGRTAADVVFTGEPPVDRVIPGGRISRRPRREARERQSAREARERRI